MVNPRKPTAPNLDRFDWTLVRTFVDVLDAGSLSAAARRSGRLQPTLSRQLAELETQLGSPLFERTGRGVAPTAMALAIADAARAMDEAAQSLSRAVAGRREQATGTVRVTTSQVAAASLLPPILAELALAEPGIQLDLVASNRIDNLLRREADIAVRMVRPSQQSLVARRLGEVGVGAYAHERYLERHGTPRRPESLAEHRLIGYDRDDTIVRGFARLGLPVERGNFALRTDDHIAYARLVEAGAGIGFLAHYDAARRPGVRRVLPQLRISPMPCWLAVHREIRSSRVVRRVFDFLADAIPRELARLGG
jgi:DNA-binding transcriptional LysR family regulator